MWVKCEQMWVKCKQMWVRYEQTWENVSYMWVKCEQMWVKCEQMWVKCEQFFIETESFSAFNLLFDFEDQMNKIKFAPLKIRWKCRETDISLLREYSPYLKLRSRLFEVVFSLIWICYFLIFKANFLSYFGHFLSQLKLALFHYILILHSSLHALLV